MGKLSYWAGAETKDDRILVPDLGSLTSIHDRSVKVQCVLEGMRIYAHVLKKCVCRARELFYFLKGGRVDYGLEHSLACGHQRYGRVYDTGRPLV